MSRGSFWGMNCFSKKISWLTFLEFDKKFPFFWLEKIGRVAKTALYVPEDFCHEKQILKKRFLSELILVFRREFSSVKANFFSQGFQNCIKCVCGIFPWETFFWRKLFFNVLLEFSQNFFFHGWQNMHFTWQQEQFGKKINFLWIFFRFCFWRKKLLEEL